MSRNAAPTKPMKESIRMIPRTPARRSAVLTAALALALVAGTPAAWSAPRAADPKPSKVPVPGPTAPPKVPVLAEAKFNPADAKNSSGSDRSGARVKINGFKADGQGLGVLYWTLRNESVEGVGLGPGDFAASDRSGESVIQPSGVRIVYEGQRHATLFHGTYCLCYRMPPGISYSYVNKGDEVLLTQVFLISPTAKTITVEIPAFHPVPNIPVQRG
jgi:hypothetical protein